MPAIPTASHDEVPTSVAAATKPAGRTVKVRPGGGEIPLLAAGPALSPFAEG